MDPNTEMNPLRTIAHTYILQTIDELDEATSQSVMTELIEMKLTNGKRSMAEELDIFAAEQSVRVYAIDWIKEEWAKCLHRDAKKFADEMLDDFMTTLD